MTLLQVVNQVLRRLREDTVTATSANSYSQLIAEFVSEIHQEVVLEHDWSNGYKDVVMDCVIGTSSYDLSATVDTTGSVISGGDVTNEYTEPQQRFVAPLYESSSSTEPRAYLQVVSEDYINYRFNEDTDNQDIPEYVSFKLNSDSTGLQARLYPIPDSTYRVNFPMWIPENVLATDTTDDDTNINIPVRPIRLGALMLAFNERGEEIGEPGNLAERKYEQALAEAIFADSKVRQMSDRYDWYRS